MQEEVTQKTIALVIKTAKLDANVLKAAMRMYLKLVLADSSRLSASDGQEPEKTEILR